MAKKFPLDTLFGSITATAELINKAIPDDELRNKKFDENAPKRRLRQLKAMLKDSVKYFEKNNLTVEEVDEFAGELGMSANFAELLKKELQNK